MAKRKTTKRSTALARRRATPPPAPTGPMDMPATFAHLARDRKIDPNKLEKLIDLQLKVMAHQAQLAFNAAFTKMSLELPVIKRNGRIMAKVKGTDKLVQRSRYAKYEDIQRVVKPILVAHGFSIRHRTEWPADKPGIVRVVGILTHIEGHSEESAFEALPDKNDYRTPIQDQGSSVSYGKRYTVLDVLNLEQEGADNDGQGNYEPPRAGRTRPIDVPPAGHDNTRDHLISDAQRRRLFVLVKKGGRTQEQVKAWLAVAYNIDSTKLIKRRDYDDICKAVEAPGPLPPPREREPGEEG